MSIKGINDLPILSNIWSTIFKNLSIQDLLNCRLVNKLFKYFSEHTNGLNKLIIGQPNSVDEYYWYYIGDDYYWYYNNKSIEDEDIISLKCFRSIKELSIFNLDTNLKYLKIYDSEFKLEELSNFINLESIEFGRGSKYRNDNQPILNLNNLKVFVSNGRSVQLDTPKLEKIQLWFPNQIKLNNPESIKHLITSKLEIKLRMFFKNLEILELRDLIPYFDEYLLSSLLFVFKNIKKLKINLGTGFVTPNIMNFKYSLIKILKDKIRLKRSIDIYLEGIKIENIDRLKELVSIGCLEWKFRLNNYDLLDLNLSFITDLYYHDLERCVNIKNDLPSSFFDKFFNINYVNVYSVKDIDGLNWFLNKLKYLNRLEINSDVSLDEVFYNNIPNTIRVLKIYNREDINYEFILKLSKLIEFYTYVDKDLFDLVFESFLNLKYLNRFTFYYKGKKITIVKNDKYFYLNEGRKLDYNQLIEECNTIKLELDQNE